MKTFINLKFLTLKLFQNHIIENLLIKIILIYINIKSLKQRQCHLKKSRYFYILLKILYIFLIILTRQFMKNWWKINY